MTERTDIKVLVACEESQAVCIAFRRLGYEAYSCDIQECSGGHPEWHIKVDALLLLGRYRHPVTGHIEEFNGGRTPIYDEQAWEYNPDTLLKGHGDKSVMLLSQFYTLTDEEIMCIRYHMGAFTDKDEWNDYTRAVRNYPNVLWTHQADMLASHVAGV